MSREPAEAERVPALDRVFEHRVRLAVAVLLARYDEVSFSRFKELLGETDGSLGAQLRKLEDEDYVKVRKEFRDRKPRTWYALTARGRRALETHLDALRRMIRTAEGGPAPTRAGRRLE